jgi:hypothetical protein
LTNGSESKSDWIPITPGDKEDVRATLDRLLEDSLFKRSSRYSALLRFIVEKTLAGMADELKERTIGIEVFHRPPGYDTNSDPVVRFCAGEIRKRLAQYFRTSTDAPVEIDVPIGSYTPVFRRRVPRHEQPQHDSSLAGAAPNFNPANALNPATDDLVEESHQNPPHPFWPLSLPVSLAVAAFLLVCLTLAIRIHINPSPIRKVWNPFLNRAEPVTICTGTPYPVIQDPVTESAPDSRDLSIEQHFLREGHRISLPTAATIAQISGFLEAHDQTFTLTEAETNSLDNLRNRPLVLVNANNNKWTLLLLNPLRFRFESQGALSYIIDRQHPERHEWHIDFSRPYIEQTEDYAIVARLFNPTTKAPVLVLAGIGSNGTQAAGEFSLSPSALAELARIAPRDWSKDNFEVVLRVEVVQGHLGAVTIIDSTFWKAQ